MAVLRSLVSLALVCLAGCGTSTAANSPDASPGPGDDAAKGGPDDAGQGGDAPEGDGAVPCPTAKVSFAFYPASGDTTRYCLGPGNGCGGSNWLSILTADGGTLSPYGPSCIADCTMCQPVACSNVCAVAGMLPDAGVTEDWLGYYVQTSTCGPTALACASSVCAAAGTYVARMCGYAETSDASLGFGCNGPTATTPTCVDVPFAWPPDGGTGKVVGVLDRGADAGAGD